MAQGKLVLADRLTGRHNNLNLMRLSAATGVLISHAFPITLGKGASEPLVELTGSSLGTHSVTVFFIISGLLIAASFERSRTVWHWGLARFFRLFPGLLVVLAATLLVLGPIATTLPLAEYFGTSATWRYLVANLSLVGLQYELPGVFGTNPYPDAINGSLWTLRYEVECYLLVGLAGMLGVLRRPALALLFVALALGLQVVPSIWGPGNSMGWIRESPMIGLGSAFGLGSAAYVLRDRLWLDVRILATAAALAVFAHGSIFFAAAQLLALTYAVLWFAYVPQGKVLLYNRYGDYSYGIYLYAFPVQQLIVWFAPDLTVLPAIGIALAATLVLAFLSWHLVEKPTLAFGKRFANLTAEAFRTKPVNPGDPG